MRLRVIVLGMAALSLLGACMYIRVDDTGEGRGGRVTDCSNADADGCRPE